MSFCQMWSISGKFKAAGNIYELERQHSFQELFTCLRFQSHLFLLFWWSRCRVALLSWCNSSWIKQERQTGGFVFFWLIKALYKDGWSKGPSEVTFKHLDYPMVVGCSEKNNLNRVWERDEATFCSRFCTWQCNYKCLKRNAMTFFFFFFLTERNI